MLQHWSIPQTLLTLSQVIFACFLERNQHRRDGAFCVAADIIKNETEELKMLSQNGFKERF